MKSAEEVIWWVLEAIKRELELQEYGLLTVINFNLEDLTSKDPNSPSIEDARKAVYLLEKKYKALEIADIDNPKERKVHKKTGLDYRPTRGTTTLFVFEMPDRTKFNEIYREYEKKFPPGVDEVYYPEVIPDNMDELIKKAEQARIRQHKEVLAERRHGQDLKQKRILATKEDKFTHAINLIIERAEYQKTKSDSFSIDYHDFNFADTMDESRVLEGFLDKLKKAGCFKNWSRTNYTGGTRFGFVGVSLKKLKSYAVAYGQRNENKTLEGRSLESSSEKHLKKTITKHKGVGGGIKFLDKKAALVMGGKECLLPPYKNEHFLCRAMFKHPKGEPVDWSAAYEEITGYYKDSYGKSPKTKENYHRVYDPVRRINQRVEKDLGIKKLFQWRELTITRLL